MNKIEKLNNEIRDLQKQIREHNKKAQESYDWSSRLEKEIELKKKEIFIESNILSQIGWILCLSTKNDLYMEPDFETSLDKYRDWSDKFFALKMSNWNHFGIIARSVNVLVNDHNIHIVPVEGKTMLDVIKDFNLTIVRNKVSEKKNSLEESLKKLIELENSITIN